MVETVCLRLAFGMIASLFVLNPDPIPPRYYRVQFLVSLSLASIAGYFLFGMQFVAVGESSESYRRIWADLCSYFVIASIGACFLGCVVWHLENASLGRTTIVMAAVSLAGLLFFSVPLTIVWERVAIASLDWWRISDNFASAALVGTAISAMLLGHSYLISPAMTIAPLQRMLVALAAAMTLRVTLACWGLWFWTAEHPLGNLDTETLLWLSARWLLGILAPLVLGWMAWETARIRSTQSATGILYVVVIVTFLGELTSLLLMQKTGYPL